MVRRTARIKRRPKKRPGAAKPLRAVKKARKIDDAPRFRAAVLDAIQRWSPIVEKALKTVKGIHMESAMRGLRYLEQVSRRPKELDGIMCFPALPQPDEPDEDEPARFRIANPRMSLEDLHVHDLFRPIWLPFADEEWEQNSSPGSKRGTPVMDFFKIFMIPPNLVGPGQPLGGTPEMVDELHRFRIRLSAYLTADIAWRTLRALGPERMLGKCVAAAVLGCSDKDFPTDLKPKRLQNGCELLALNGASTPNGLDELMPRLKEAYCLSRSIGCHPSCGGDYCWKDCKDGPRFNPCIGVPFVPGQMITFKPYKEASYSVTYGYARDVQSSDEFCFVGPWSTEPHAHFTPAQQAIPRTFVSMALP